MPLTQDRMIAVLDETAEAIVEYDRLRKAVQDALNTYAEGRATAEGTLAEITQAASRAHPLPMRQWAVESAHFAKVRKANARAAERNAVVRAVKGTPSRRVPAPIQAPALPRVEPWRTLENTLHLDDPSQPLPGWGGQPVAVPQPMTAAEIERAVRQINEQPTPPVPRLHQPRAVDMGNGRTADLSEMEPNVIAPPTVEDLFGPKKSES